MKRLSSSFYIVAKSSRFLSSIFISIYVSIFAFLYRLPSLGLDFIGNDDFLWKGRGYAFGQALMSGDFIKTAVTYHPGVTLLYSQFVAIKLYTLMTSLGFGPSYFGLTEFLLNHILQKFVFVSFTSVLIGFTYYGLSKVFGRFSSLLIVFIILLEPFYIALTRAIHLDALMSILSFNCILFFWIFLCGQKEKFKIDRFFLLSAIFLGLALLTKSSSLFLLPFIFLVLILFKYKKENFIKSVITINNVKIYSVWFLLGLAIFFMLWPAMWVDPVNTLGLYLFKGIKGVAIDEGHSHVWFGQITDDPGAWFYPVAIVARFSATFVLLFILSVFAVFIAKRNVISNQRNFIYVCFLYFIFYLLMITLVSKKLDRYSLPILFPMSVIVGYYISTYFSIKKVFLGAFVYLLSAVLTIYTVHPNYLAYYSPLVGGYDYGRYVIEPKWLVGYDEVAKYFNEKNNSDLKVAIADFDYLVPFSKFRVVDIKVESQASKADYLILPAYRQVRNEFYKNRYMLSEPESIIKIAGVEYYYVYVNNAKVK